jgi:hypothetical protein
MWSSGQVSCRQPVPVDPGSGRSKSVDAHAAIHARALLGSAPNSEIDSESSEVSSKSVRSCSHVFSCAGRPPVLVPPLLRDWVDIYEYGLTFVGTRGSMNSCRQPRLSESGVPATALARVCAAASPRRHAEPWQRTSATFVTAKLRVSCADSPLGPIGDSDATVLAGGRPIERHGSFIAPRSMSCSRPRRTSWTRFMHASMSSAAQVHRTSPRFEHAGNSCWAVRSSISHRRWSVSTRMPNSFE